MGYPFTGSSLSGRIASSLSTQIQIEVDNQRIGAIQRFAPNQNRPIIGISEVGTDGFIEKVPNGPTDIKVSVERIVFDLLRLPQSMARAFRNIHAQRVPFNIREYDVSAVGVDDQDADGGLPPNANVPGILLTEYVDCWFSSLSTQYESQNYLISENAEIEVTSIRTILAPESNSFRTVLPFGSNDDYERIADRQRVGSLDAVGLSQVINGPLS